MRLSYARPVLTNVITGTGAAWISPTDGSALTSGRPADVQRIRWLSAASPATSDFVTITATFGAAIKAGCCALLLPNLGTAVPAGVKVTFSGKLSGGAVVLGGNTITTRTQLLPNGAVAIWCVFPAVNIDTLIVKIYNDQNGSTWATASQYVDLGELWVGKVADFNVANDIKTVWKDATLQRRSHNNQAWALQTQPFREVTAHVVPMTEAVAIGPNSAQDDYETVAYALSTSTCCVLIESYLIRGPLNGNSPTNGSPPSTIDSTTISVQRLHRTAVLGVIGGESGTPIETNINGDQYYTSPIVIGESPP